ncbi:MAG: RNA polymerase sigma factor [Polyangiaceae bacterium]
MDVVTPARDPQLLGFLERGDLRAAGTWLVDRYAGDVVAVCRAMVRPRDVADDLAQDTFSAAFSALAGFRRDASVRTWLLAIARNRCIDHLRRERRRPFDPWDDDDETGLAVDPGPLPPEVILTRDDVAAALNHLDESERALVILRFRHGLEYPELAEVFGVKQGTVRMRLSRALGRMRGELERREAPILEEAAAEYMPPPAAAPAPAMAPAALSRGRASAPGGIPTAPAAIAPPRAMAPPPGARPQAFEAPPHGAPPPGAPGAPPPPFGAPAPGAPLPPAPAPASAGSARSRAGWLSRLWGWLRGAETVADDATVAGDAAVAGDASPLHVEPGIPSVGGAWPFDDEPGPQLSERLSRLAERLPNSAT